MNYLLCWRGWLENGKDGTVNIFTVSFFGHRAISDFCETEKRLEALIHRLLLEKKYVEFLVGRDGDFDQMVSSVVKELRDNMGNLQAYYDEIEICSSAANSHPKGAFQIRNRQMVNRSDLVVFYVDHNSGGAYQTLRYAQNQKKYIINLGRKKGIGK